MRILVAISRAATVEPTYTTIHIANAALRRGHLLRFVEPWDFEIEPTGRLVARTHAFNEPLPAREDLVRQLSERRAARRYVDLSQVDVLLLRVNPLDHGVLAFAQLARRAGVPVFNDPRTLQFTGHKAYLASLQGVPRPRTLVTRSRGAAHLFAAELRDAAVVKPARSSGGRGVSLVRPASDARKLDQAFDLARAHGDGYVVVQEYLPEAREGERRLVWLDGEIIGGYLRARAPGEFRHNLARGGQPRPYRVTARDHQLLSALSEQLLADGVWFAGIDVIGDYVVEVNTLNPGGVHYGDSLNGTDMADRIVENLERLEAASWRGAASRGG